MATVNFAANIFVYYLNSEHYETLYNEEEKHGFHIPLILYEEPFQDRRYFFAPLARLTYEYIGCRASLLLIMWSRVRVLPHPLIIILRCTTRDFIVIA